MANTQVRRMPVGDRRQHLVGLVTLGDIAAKDVSEEDEVATFLGDTSSPARPDRSASRRPVARPEVGRPWASSRGGNRAERHPGETASAG